MPGEVARGHPQLLRPPDDRAPLARAGPAGRLRRPARYFGGWFTKDEIHVLSPEAPRRARVEGPGLCAGPAALAAARVRAPRDRCEQPGAAAPLQPALVPQLHEVGLALRGRGHVDVGPDPYLAAAIAAQAAGQEPAAFPPSPRDAMLLGGSVFDLLERGSGARRPASQLMSRLDPAGPGPRSSAPSPARSARSGVTGWPRSRSSRPRRLDHGAGAPAAARPPRPLPEDFGKATSGWRPPTSTLGPGVPDALVPRTPIDPDEEHQRQPPLGGLDRGPAGRHPQPAGG